MSSPTILIVDDEVEILRLLEITLQSNDFKVLKAMRAREGLIMAANHPPDLIILDLGLPDASGHEVLKKLREWYVNPIIILSVRDREDDIVKALESGANDYVIKPFRTGELLARIRSALRRSARDESGEIEFNGLSIDLSRRLAKLDGEHIKLTSTEYNLLAMLVKNEGKVLTHQYLLQQIWGPGYIDQTQYLRVYIAQLRKKIERDPNQPEHILTESGVGYRFMGNA